MCPPSSLPDCDVILEKFLLVSNLHCAGGGVITPVGSLYWSSLVSRLGLSLSLLFSSVSPRTLEVLVLILSVVTCHLVTTQKRKLGKFSDCQPGNWTSPFSVSGGSLTLAIPLMVCLSNAVPPHSPL